MKLIDGEVTKMYEVHTLHMAADIERRMEALGLTYGSKIVIQNKKNNGAMIVKIRGTRFALGKNIIEHIDVEDLPYE